MTNECPMCDSEEVEGNAIDIDSNYASQEVNCLACGAEWLDIYSLTGYTLTDPGTRKLALTFHEDPGHGWLEAPASMLAQLDIEHKISSYSYQHNGQVYLEEDQDLTTFMNAAKAKGWEISMTRVYEDPTPIRGYPSYQSLDN